MSFGEKLLRGKSILFPGGDRGDDEYNVLHILAGTAMMILIPASVYFISGGNAMMMYVAQYVSAALVGLLVGFLAGCVPSITLLVIIGATTGRLLYRLLGGRMGSFGSAEFNGRLLAWTVFVAMLFGSAYIGAKMKEGRRRRSHER